MLCMCIHIIACRPACLCLDCYLDTDVNERGMPDSSSKQHQSYLPSLRSHSNLQGSTAHLFPFLAVIVPYVYGMGLGDLHTGHKQKLYPIANSVTSTLPSAALQSN